MTRKNKIPKFPNSYIGDKAKEYDRQKWMERNQKRTTHKVLEYLIDKKLGEHDIQQDYSCLILDLGCGSGFSSEVLIENGFRVIGIEILKDMLSLAKKRKKLLEYTNLDLILADINYLPLKPKKIDHIISVSAYNFITHHSSSLREERKIVNNTAKDLYRILKNEGRIIIELYPKDDKDLDLFKSSFTSNGFDGFMIKNDENQRGGQTFLLLKKLN